MDVGSSLLSIYRRNTWRSVLLVCLVCCLGVQSYKMAHLRSSSGFRYYRTSSTLAWTTSRIGKALPENAVPVDKSKPSIVWCRARHSSLLLPGEVEAKGACKLAFLNSVVSYDDEFDVLVSLSGFARIRLQPSDFVSKPDNALLSPDRILAVHYSEQEGRYVAANIGPENSDREAFMAQGEDVVKADEASILVEDEPVRYSLSDVSFDKKKVVVTTRSINLNSTELRNEDNVTAEVAELVPYMVKESQYWGRVKGTITSLETEVATPEDGVVEILWGTESEYKRVKFAEIFYTLPPFSAVPVTLMGTVKVYEAPYSGSLEAFYSDGFSTAKRIESLHIGKGMVTVIAKYGRPFYLNGTEIDEDEISKLVYELTTTTTTTSTTTSTTTTTTATTTTTTTEPTTTVIPQSSTETIEVSESKEALAPSAMQTKELDWQPESLEKTEDDTTRLREKSRPSREKNEDHSAKLSSTSDRILSGLSTIFTALVFWYFSLGAPA